MKATRGKTKKLPAKGPLDLLADQIGQFIHFWGFKQIHGVLWTHLFLSDELLTATDLTKKVKISKALVSLSLADLEKFGLISASYLDGNRKKKYYQATDEVFLVIQGILQKRERALLNAIQAGYLEMKNHTLSSQPNVQLDRFEKLGQWIGGASQALDQLIEVIALAPTFFAPQVSSDTH